MPSFIKALKEKASRSKLRHWQAPSAKTQNSIYGSSEANASTSSLLFWRKSTNQLLTISEPKPILIREPSPVPIGGPPGPSNVSNSFAASGSGSTSSKNSLHSRELPGPPSAFRQPAYLMSPPTRPARTPSPAGRAVSNPPVQRYHHQHSDMSDTMSRALTAGPALAPAPVMAASADYDPLSATGHSRSSIDRRRSLYYPSLPEDQERPERGGARSVSPNIVKQAPSAPVPQAAQQAPAMATRAQRPPPLQLHHPQARRPNSMMNTVRRRSSRPSLPSNSRTRESLSSLRSLTTTPSTTPSPVSPTFSISQNSNGSVPTNVPIINREVMLNSPIPTINRVAAMATTLSTVPQSPEQAPVTPQMNYGSLCGTPDSPSLASTPGGACPWTPNALLTPNLSRSTSLARTTSVARSNSTLRRRLSTTDEGSPLPLFKVIPATPHIQVQMTTPPVLQDNRQREEPPEVLKETSSVKDKSLKETSACRVLDFGEADWCGEPSPTLNEAIPLVPGSPFSMHIASFRRSNSNSNSNSDDSDSGHATPTTPPVGRDFPRAFPKTKEPVTPPRNPARMSMPAAGPPPPKPARNPARTRSTLYDAHDDGRSISHSLAELAALACDLPPFDEGMTTTAKAAAARLAAARMATDTPRNSPPRSLKSRSRRAPPRTPPRSALPPIPTHVAPFSKATTLVTVPRRVPVPVFAPTASLGAAFEAETSGEHDEHEFNSFSSLPSLVSDSSQPLLSMQCDSTLSLASTLSDVEEAVVMVRQTSSHSGSGSGCGRLTPSTDSNSHTGPTTPKAAHADLVNLRDLRQVNGPVGLGFDFSARYSPASVSPGSQTSSGTAETYEFPLPPSSSSHSRISLRDPHRMSVVATNPNRTAFYGSEAFLSRAVMSSESVHSVVGLGLGHATHESVSSINTMSSLNSVDYGSEAEADEAEAVYTANLVAFKACGPAKYIRREDGNDVGVAF